MSPRDRSPVRTSSSRRPSGTDLWNQLSPYNLTLLQLEQTNGGGGGGGYVMGAEGALVQKIHIICMHKQNN